VNLCSTKGLRCGARHKDGAGLRAGDFIVAGGPQRVEEWRPVAGWTSWRPSRRLKAAQRLRIAMYQRYRGGNMDEGWTRLVLEAVRLPYTSVMDSELKRAA
jgi:hypothetical protein